MSDSPIIIEVLPAGLKQNWAWVFGLGVLLVLLGTLGLGAVMLLTLASIMLLGMLLIIAGLAQFIDIYKSRHWKKKRWPMSIACLYVLCGGIVTYDPVLASSIVTILLAWSLIVIGTTRIAMAITNQNALAWSWLLFAGICSTVLGILILIQWPASALWVIGLVIAVELIITGWSYIFIGLAMRRL